MNVLSLPSTLMLTRGAHVHADFAKRLVGWFSSSEHPRANQHPRARRCIFPAMMVAAPLTIFAALSCAVEGLESS